MEIFLNSGNDLEDYQSMCGIVFINNEINKGHAKLQRFMIR